MKEKSEEKSENSRFVGTMDFGKQCFAN